MAAIDMPANPTVNQSEVASNGVTYIWDGEKWNAAQSNPGPGPGGGASVSVGQTPPADASLGRNGRVGRRLDGASAARTVGQPPRPPRRPHVQSGARLVQRELQPPGH